MEKVNSYSCVSTPLTFLSGVNVNKASQVQSDVFKTGAVSQPTIDTVNFRSKKEILTEKFNKLFPNNEFSQIYDNITKDFGIDKQPTLKLYDEEDGVAGGGYTFNRNEISMSLSDLLDSDTKIVGIKDGKRIVLISPSVKLPLFVDKQSADAFIKMQSQHGNMGFDELIAEPLTPKEQKKFIVQKISHEMVHAQQHMIMRQTEGIGEKEVYKAWLHEKPQNMIEKAILDIKVNTFFPKTYWGNQPETEKTISADSPKGKIAHLWLDAVRNYPPVDSPEYVKNPIEQDAYNRSAQYANAKFGPWI